MSYVIGILIYSNDSQDTDLNVVVEFFFLRLFHLVCASTNILWLFHY